MLRRILTGGAVLLVLFGAWHWDSTHQPGPAWATALLGAVLSLGALDELLVIGLARSGRRRFGIVLGCMWLAILVLPGLLPNRVNELCADVLTAAALVANLYLVFQLRVGPGPLPNRLAGSLWFQVPYVGGVACFVGLLAAGLLHYAVGVALLVKASDTGAYFLGRFTGRHKLAPQISPNKTMEGAIGGLLLPTLLAPLLLEHAELALPGGPPGLALHGLVIGVLAVVSDLAESLLKRSRGVKDSGRAFGPSGGFLDLADSLLLVGPFALAYTAVLA